MYPSILTMAASSSGAQGPPPAQGRGAGDGGGGATGQVAGFTCFSCRVAKGEPRPCVAVCAVPEGRGVCGAIIESAALAGVPSNVCGFPVG